MGTAAEGVQGILRKSPPSTDLTRASPRKSHARLDAGEFR